MKKKTPPPPLPPADYQPGRPIPASLSINSFMHCGKCLEEWKTRAPGTEGTSPQTYSRLSVGFTPIGLQVWCNRHEANIVHIDFEGAKHPANLNCEAVGLGPEPTKH